MPEVRKLWQTEGLFSDHYLKVRLRLNDWWPADAAARPIWEFCKTLTRGVEAHALKPKTKLDEFWKLESAEVFAHFRANNCRLKKGEEERLRDCFLEAKAQLVPLEKQIAFTDALIDQIVYRLYGLTPEEMRLVEDSVKC